jgi:hypothetical protein
VTASTELLIGDPDGAHVVVRAVGRRHPHLFDAAEGNWIACDVELAAGGFRAAFNADFRSEDLRDFLAELDALGRSLEGAATFTSLEGQLRLTLAAESAGQVVVQGEAADTPGSENRLVFGFEIDQSYLPSIVRSLELMVAAYPARQS